MAHFNNPQGEACRRQQDHERSDARKRERDAEIKRAQAELLAAQQARPSKEERLRLHVQQIQEQCAQRTRIRQIQAEARARIDAIRRGEV